MRLAPLYDAGSPFNEAANLAPAPAFSPTPFNELLKPLDQDSRGLGQRRFRGFPSPSNVAAPVFGGVAGVGSFTHRSNTFDSTPRFTTDTLVRPVLPRLTPWPELPHASAETRRRMAEEEVVPNKRYARYDSQVVHEEAATAVDYQETIEVPLRQPSSTTSPRNPDGPSGRPKPVKTTRRREQCRANQARYRERQKRKVWIKEEEVACLRELVSLLEVQRSLTRSGSGRHAFTQYIVVELFRRFRNGLSGARLNDSTRSTASSTKSRAMMPMKWDMARHVERNLTFLKQIAFVRTVVNNDAVVGDGLRGLDAVLEQCWRYSTLHANLKLELIDVERECNSDSHTERVTVKGSLKVSVTEQTLAMVFPDLPLKLYRKLIGAKLNYNLRLRLELEKPEVHPLLQVTKLHAELDVLSALLDTLKDPADVERVMRYALISSNGVIRKLADHFGQV